MDWNRATSEIYWDTRTRTVWKWDKDFALIASDGRWLQTGVPRTKTRILWGIYKWLLMSKCQVMWLSGTRNIDKLTTVFLIWCVSAVIFAVTHKGVCNTLPVGAFELSGITAVGDQCASRFVWTVTALIHTITELPIGDTHIVCATKLCYKTTVGRCRERNYIRLIRCFYI